MVAVWPGVFAAFQPSALLHGYKPRMPRTCRLYAPASLSPPPMPPTPCPPPYEAPRWPDGRLKFFALKKDRKLTFQQAAICWSQNQICCPPGVFLYDSMYSPPQLAAPVNLLADLEQRRAALGMSKTSLSLLSGVPIATVRRALRRGRKPISVSLDTVLRLADAMGARVGLVGYSARRTRNLADGKGSHAAVVPAGWPKTPHAARRAVAKGLRPIPESAAQAYYKPLREFGCRNTSRSWSTGASWYADHHDPRRRTRLLARIRALEPCANGA